MTKEEAIVLISVTTGAWTRRLLCGDFSRCCWTTKKAAFV